MVLPSSSTTPHLGGKLAFVVFVFTLLAFVAESQLTQYVQITLNYRQPYFIFYIVHSSFWIIFPLHLLYLKVVKNYSWRALSNGLNKAISKHLSSPLESSSSSSVYSQFPTYKLIRLILGLTFGVTLPGLLWFAAISLASITDVTAIWNTNAFFAYIITVKLFGLKWEPRKLIAVSIATLGTLAVVYGGSSSSAPDESESALRSTENVDQVVSLSQKPSAPLVGDVLTVIAAFLYGLYQVMYKRYAALPSDPELASEGLYQQISASDDSLTSRRDADDEEADVDNIVHPPPFGLHANFLTSAIGLATMLIVWIPLPVLHMLDIEPFSFPADWKTTLSIAAISFSGVIFNAGFMVLLGVWGPIITSVGNLLTIVLVFISDVVFGIGLDALTTWGLLGSGAIIAAFAVLVYDMFSK